MFIILILLLEKTYIAEEIQVDVFLHHNFQIQLALNSLLIQWLVEHYNVLYLLKHHFSTAGNNGI